MKKVYIKAYLKRNLGDDLFVKILANRYKNRFTMISRPKYKYNKEFKNVKVYNSISYYLTKVYEMVTTKSNNKNKYILEKKAIEESDIIVRIGGSIFIEESYHKNPDIEVNAYKYNKPYYIVGANFGPYKSKKYIEFVENKIIKNSCDTCFRDNFSYLLFKDNSNVRKASDIVFTLDKSNIKITNSKKVVISVIDCGKKGLSNKDIYEQKIIDMIKFFIKKKYEIVLMSFCKHEGDETAIESIYNKIDDDSLKKYIYKYYYRKNITEALNVLGDCQIIVGTRFHANILGLVMDKTIIPIIYSDKTYNIIKDLKFKGKVFDIRDINTFDISSITKEDLNYKLDISMQKKLAEKQFEKLDEILERSEKNV